MPRIPKSTRKPRSNRRLLLVVGLVLIVLAGGGMFAFREHIFSPSVPNWITFNPSSTFSNKEKADIIKTAQEWDAKFPCGANVQFSRMKVERVGGIFIPERAERGKIALDPEFEYYGATMRDVILHSMTHACAGLKVNADRDYTSVHGVRAINWEGLAVVWQVLGTNNTAPKNDMEEGGAEFLAASFPNFHPSDDEVYMHWHQAMRDLGMTPQEVWGYMKNSDLIGFTARVVNKPRDQVTGDDLSHMMDLFFIRPQ